MNKTNLKLIELNQLLKLNTYKDLKHADYYYLQNLLDFTSNNSMKTANEEINSQKINRKTSKESIQSKQQRELIEFDNELTQYIQSLLISHENYKQSKKEEILFNKYISIINFPIKNEENLNNNNELNELNASKDCINEILEPTINTMSQIEEITNKLIYQNYLTKNEINEYINEINNELNPFIISNIYNSNNNSNNNFNQLIKRNELFESMFSESVQGVTNSLYELKENHKNFLDKIINTCQKYSPFEIVIQNK